MSDNNIPHGDADFDKFQAQYISTVSADPTKYGLYQEDVDALAQKQTAWIAAYPAHTKAHEGALSAKQAKDAARDALEGVIRPTIRKANATEGVDNAARAAAGIALHQTSHSPIGAPTSKPVAQVTIASSLTLVLDIADEHTPHKPGKPHGVTACQIFSHVGDPAPTDASGFAYLAECTRSPFTDVHPMGDAGKSAYYLLRWKNAKGDFGPWSQIVSAKIPA